MSATHHSKGQHHHSHAGQFVASLTVSQKNSLRLLLAKDAAADLHYLLGVQKAVTRAVTEAEHKLALAQSGRTAELFRSQHARVVCLWRPAVLQRMAHQAFFLTSKENMKTILSSPSMTGVSVWAVLFCTMWTPAQIPKGAIGIAYQFSHSVNDSPSFSPDGEEMVFISVVAGKEQLFRMRLDGTQVVELTRDDADHEDPAWSPDGKHIAFVLIRNGLEQIHLMNTDGTGVEPLTPAEVKTIHPNWNPDGKSIAYCTDDDLKPPKKNPAEINSIEIVSRKITKLIDGGVNTYPAWSPDGKKIAFRRMLGESNSEVFLAKADGSEAHNLTNDPAFDGWPAWSPDGTKIAFASNRRGSYEIYIMNPDGSGVRKVANNEGRATAPQWAKDGKSIFFPLCKKVDFSFDCQIYAVKLDAFAK